LFHSLTKDLSAVAAIIGLLPVPFTDLPTVVVSNFNFAEKETENMKPQRAAIILQSNWRGYLGRQKYFSELLAQERNRVKSAKQQKKHKTEQAKQNSISSIKSKSRDSLDPSSPRSFPRNVRLIPNKSDLEPEYYPDEEEIIVYKASKKGPIVKASAITSFHSSLDPSQGHSMNPKQYPKRMGSRDESDPVEQSLDSLADFQLDKIDEEDEFLRDSLSNTREKSKTNNAVPTISLAKSTNFYQIQIPSTKAVVSPPRYDNHDQIRKTSSKESIPQKSGRRVQSERVLVPTDEDGIDELSPRINYLEEDQDDGEDDDSLELPVQTIIRKSISSKQQQHQQDKYTSNVKPSPINSVVNSNSNTSNRNLERMNSNPNSNNNTSNMKIDKSNIPRYPSAKKTRPAPLSDGNMMIGEMEDRSPRVDWPDQPRDNKHLQNNNTSSNRIEKKNDFVAQNHHNNPAHAKPTQVAPVQSNNVLDNIVDQEKFLRLKRMYEESASINQIVPEKEKNVIAPTVDKSNRNSTDSYNSYQSQPPRDQQHQPKQIAPADEKGRFTERDRNINNDYDGNRKKNQRYSDKELQEDDNSRYRFQHSGSFFCLQMVFCFAS
jgi:hypothetical protein